MLTVDDPDERRFYEIEATQNNYFDRHVKLPDELPTVGIILCRRKNDALVELTVPEDANIFASKYQLYLPSKQELKLQLEKIQRELGDKEGEV